MRGVLCITRGTVQEASVEINRLALFLISYRKERLTQQANDPKR
uniref:Uncharacterized protein n=1 Tax=Arundo donax TaxID=35708 RepID=A0A0A8XUW2_ARUDO